MDRHRWISRNQQVWEYGCSFLYFDPETNRLILSYESLNDDTSLGNYFHPQYQKKNNGDNLLSMKVRFLGHSCIEIIGYRHILIDPDFNH